MTALEATFIDRINALGSSQWNHLVGDTYPFLRHEFLWALEESGSVSADTGWTPQHLIIKDHKDELVAIAPTYLKEHSYGEYVFDWSWADAYQRNHIPYYPKLLTAIPFTPSVGPRLVVSPAYNTAETWSFCLQTIIDFCVDRQLSSWHLLFPDSHTAERLKQQTATYRLMKRSGVQFHWYNDGYQSFADYLKHMKARKRNSIRKERAHVAKQGITFTQLSGREISPAQLNDFYTFYHATYMKRGQYGYLNRRFFELLVETMPESLLFILAHKDGGNVAAALFFTSADTLYGRYWGCLEAYKFLHFETCYYQGIDYCITRQLAHFDAGAQGEHKIQRGFRPIETLSYHWVAHPTFASAIGNFLEQERPHIQAYLAEASTYLPFKQTPQPEEQLTMNNG